jgi:hypothetical protein
MEQRATAFVKAPPLGYNQHRPSVHFDLPEHRLCLQSRKTLC